MLQTITTKAWAEIDALCRLADEQTWVIWDVDNTLLLANDIVFGARDDLYKQQVRIIEDYELVTSQGTRDQRATKNLWYKARSSLPVCLMAPEIPSTIANLQTRNITTFALTYMLVCTQEHDYTAWREQQLVSLGIDFSKTPPLPGTIEFKSLSLTLNDVSAPQQGAPTLKNGIFYTHHCKKSACLTHLIQQKGMMPQKVIFVDDALGNLEDVGHLALQMNFDFTGIHYTGYKNFGTRCEQLDPHLLERWQSFKKSGVWPTTPILAR